LCGVNEAQVSDNRIRGAEAGTFDSSGVTLLPRNTVTSTDANIVDNYLFDGGEAGVRLEATDSKVAGNACRNNTIGILEESGSSGVVWIDTDVRGNDTAESMNGTGTISDPVNQDTTTFGNLILTRSLIFLLPAETENELKRSITTSIREVVKRKSLERERLQTSQSILPVMWAPILATFVGAGKPLTKVLNPDEILIKDEPVVNVQHPDFGVVADGQTDDTDALRSPLSHAAAVRSAAYFPPGDYAISEGTDSDVSIIGPEEGKATFLVTSSIDGWTISLSVADITARNISINGQNNAARGLWVRSDRQTIENVTVENIEKQTASGVSSAWGHRGRISG
jgi:hypothetical protein